MLEDFFVSRVVIARLREGVLGELVDDLAGALHARGHSSRTIRDYLRGVGHLGFWLGAKQIPLARVDEETIRQFLGGHLPGCSCPVPSGRPLRQMRAGISHLLSMLRLRGLISGPQAPPPTPSGRLVESYQDYLRQVRGAAPTTCRLYAAHATALLEAKFGKGTVDLGRLDQGDIARFVVTKARVLAPGGGVRLASALRSFARFLHVKGHCDAALIDGIPAPSSRGASRPPTALDDRQLSALLAAFDRGTETGRRDYAMAVCMADLGLRAGEVASLTLDDVDWSAGTLRIAAGKSRRETLLPLPGRVGAALADYLQGGHPVFPARRVFVRHVVPRDKPLSADAVRAAIRRAFGRAGTSTPSTGTHILRRTAATRMVRAGATLKEVADVLRHRSIDTTVRYARVNLGALAAVAMPWPGRQQ